MALIKEKDIATLRKFVKMNFTAEAVKSMPDLDTAERRYLKPILGNDLYEDLQRQVTNDLISTTELLYLSRAVAAPLAIWLDLPFYQASLGDGGIKSAGDDAAHQWEYRAIEQALLNKGMAALEDLIKHLIENANDYSWTNEDTTKSFFKTGDDFSKYAFLNQPHVTFQQLKPLITEVEDHFIRSAIGDSFFNELRDKASPSADEAKAILLIKKTIAQYTVVRAVERMPVKITPSGLMATLQNNSEAVNKDTPAKDSALERLKESAQREGDSYHVQLKQFLNTKASSSLFSGYFNTEFYKALGGRIDVNDTLTGICVM